MQISKEIDDCFRRMIREQLENNSEKTMVGASLHAGRSKGWLSLYMSKGIEEMGLRDFCSICNYFEIEPSWFFERVWDGDFLRSGMH